MLKTEHTLNQEILALVAQRTLAQELVPVYNMTPHNALNPREEEKKVEYLTKEETLARKRIEYEEKSKEEYRKTHVKGEFKMLDVRTHKKIFRPWGHYLLIESEKKIQEENWRSWKEKKDARIREKAKLLQLEKEQKQKKVTQLKG